MSLLRRIQYFPPQIRTFCIIGKKILRLNGGSTSSTFLEGLNFSAIAFGFGLEKNPDIRGL